MKSAIKRFLLHVPLAGRIIRARDARKAERHAVMLAGKPTEADRTLYPYPLLHKPHIAYHENIYPWLAGFANHENMRVLEIGSREVCSASIWKQYIPRCNYVGFDVLAGANVDVVGDAHRLSEYFEPESFDVIVSLAVFEHLAMPWLVAEEITKLLKVGGHVCIETHFSFSEHELPWHFFQFNKRALECLFNPGLGYEILDSGMDNPIVGRFAHDASEYLRGKRVPGLYCHSSIIAKKIKSLPPGERVDPWRSSYEQFIQGSMYPKNTGLSAAE